MAVQRKTWVVSQTNKSEITERRKINLSHLGDQVVEEELKPLHVKHPPKNYKLNYIIDIYTKWQRDCFYFCARYSNADGRDFNLNFARLEAKARGKYDLAYLRHTGKWWVTNKNLSAKAAIDLVKEGGLFDP